MVVHLYGVTTANAPPTSVKGRRDGAVRLVSDGGLAVIVSDVDPEAAADRKDLLAHAHVLEWFAEHATVVPMRFGIALPDDGAVKEQVLDHDRESLEYLVQQVQDLVQLTVQAFHHEEPALREVMHRDPDLVTLRAEALSFPESQPRQVRLGQAVADALGALQEEDRTVILDRLAPLARAVAENDTKGAHEIVHVAFLVERGSRQAFDEAVGALREEMRDRVRLRYVGPQPPYSFLEAIQSGELAWD